MTDEKPFSISATLTPTEVRALMAEYKRRYGPKFEKGDLVVLKSGSTQMTVRETETTPSGVEKAYCTWYRNDVGRYETQLFPVACLNLN